MQDVKKVDIENKNNHKRDRRRKRNMTGYYFLVAVLVIGIAATLSVTLLFNVHEVVITGMQGSSYTDKEIIESSGISRGDNLVRMKTDRIRQSMLDTLTLIDDVTITKVFPETVSIEIVPSQAIAYVQCKGGYMLVSESWRIIGHAEQPDDRSLIVINGFDCESNEEKTTMTSTDPDKNTALKEILHEISAQDIQNMVSVDLTDKYDIVLNYDNRIKIKIEKQDDIEYKLRYAYKIITDELRDNKNGYLIYRNSMGYSYVSDEEYNRINGSMGSMVPAVPDDYAAEQTDVTGLTEAVSASETDAAVSSVVTASQAEPQAGW